MSVEASEPCSVEGLQRSRWSSAIATRLRATGHRFPVASSGLFSILDQAIFSGTSFLTAALIGHATSPEQLGLYYLVLSIILTISGVLEQLIAVPYVVCSKRFQGRELAEYAGSMWTFYLLGSSFAVIGLLVAILVLNITGQSTIIPGLWALVGAAPMLLFRQWIRRFTFASLKLRSAIVLDSAVAVLQLAGLVLLGYFGMLSLFRIFVVMGGACGLACVGWYLLARPRLKIVRVRFLGDWQHNWVFGKWSVQTYVLGNITPQLMLWIVSATIGAAATGVFGACNNLVGMAYVLLCGVDNVLTPQAAHAFAAGGVRELRRVLLLAGTFLAIAMGALCLFILMTGDWLVVLAFGAHYQGTGLILITLALSTSMSGLSIVVGNGLWAIHQPRANFVADVCCISVTLIAAALLIYPFGALGAALGTLAGTFTAAVVRLITLIRHLEGHALELSTSVNPALSS